MIIMDPIEAPLQARQEQTREYVLEVEGLNKLNATTSFFDSSNGGTLFVAPT